MNKRIIVGSVLVLTLLLLMPSIPAVHKNIVEEEFKQELQERLEEIDLEEIKNLSGNYSWPFPIIYLLFLIFGFRCIRGIYLFGFGVYFSDLYFDINRSFSIFYKIIEIRGLWLLFTGFILTLPFDILLYIINPDLFPEEEVLR